MVERLLHKFAIILAIGLFPLLLKEQPYLDAPPTTNLPAGTMVEVIQRQGGWMRVRSGSTEGWLKMTAVKLGTADTTSGKSGGSLGTLVNLATTGRSGSSGVTVTTGVRGLGQEELKNAQPDHDAVERMNRFSGTKNEAASFAAQAGLVPQAVEYIGAPAATPVPTGGASANHFGRGN
jgi:hypothetical protein